MAISGKHSWIENSDVVSLFPTLVWKIQLRAEVHEPIDASALGLLHPNNYLSAVYYVRTRPGADTINFHDPRSQTGVIRPPVTELTAANTDQVVVRVGNGTLLVFPSYLQHSVDANASGESRVSLSFNLMFSAFTTALSKPLWGDE
jgi:hypothetical protein